jgi:hypothetical protein
MEWFFSSSNFIDNTSAAATASSITLARVGLPKSMILLVRPVTFAGEALCYLLVRQIGYACRIRITTAKQKGT